MICAGETVTEHKPWINGQMLSYCSIDRCLATAKTIARDKLIECTHVERKNKQLEIYAFPDDINNRLLWDNRLRKTFSRCFRQT